jgi:hypothetical protein
MKQSEWHIPTYRPEFWLLMLCTYKVSLTPINTAVWYHAYILEIEIWVCFLIYKMISLVSIFNNRIIFSFSEVERHANKTFSYCCSSWVAFAFLCEDLCGKMNIALSWKSAVLNSILILQVTYSVTLQAPLA